MKASNLYRTAALRLSKPLREPTRAPPWRSVIASNDRRMTALRFSKPLGEPTPVRSMMNCCSRWCRSPCPREHHSGSGRGRKPSRLTAREWRTVVVMLYKPWRAPIAFQAMSARLSGEPSRIGAPARIRSENLRVLSAAPLPYWATGQRWYARSDSNRYWRGPRPRASCLLGYARLVRAEGFQPTLDRV